MRSVGQRGGDLGGWRVTKTKATLFSRRTFLRGIRWAPVLLLPAPLQASPFRLFSPETPAARASPFPFADFRLTPHYPVRSPLDDVLLKVIPGTDEYLTEKYGFEIMQLLDEWSVGLKTAPPALNHLTGFLDASIEAAALQPSRESMQRTGNGIEVWRKRFPRDFTSGR
jgi:hypothetical protein